MLSLVYMYYRRGLGTPRYHCLYFIYIAIGDIGFVGSIVFNVFVLQQVSVGFVGNVARAARANV